MVKLLECFKELGMVMGSPGDLDKWTPLKFDEVKGTYHVECRSPLPLEDLRAQLGPEKKLVPEKKRARSEKPMSEEQRQLLMQRIFAKHARKARVDKQVKWLVSLCQDQRPGSNEAVLVPAQLAGGKKAETFMAGKFLDHITGNWTGAKQKTQLTVKQKWLVEQLSWFPPEWR